MGHHADDVFRPLPADWRTLVFPPPPAALLVCDRPQQAADRQPQDALASFVEARDAFAGLLARKPELANDLADADGWVAEAYEAFGDYAGAITAQITEKTKIASI